MNAIDLLTPDQKNTVGKFWISRAVAELDASGHFEIMASRLAARNAPSPIVELAKRAVEDEKRHAASCQSVASAYLGTPAPELAPPNPSRPSFGVAGRDLTTTLHVVSSSCISEGIATAFLRACLKQAAGEPVRSALRAMLEDEIHHARIGWAHLATLAQPERREVDRALPALLRLARTTWLATDSSAPRGHGALSSSDLQAVVDDAIESLIVPGFQRIGGGS